MTYQNLDADNDGVVDADVDNQSVSTGSADINNRNADAFVSGIDGSAKMVQHGDSTVFGPSGASDATWDTFEDVNETITFDEAFGASPSLAHMKQQSNGAELVANALNVSTTGFELRKVNFSTTDFSDDLNTTWWIAVGDE